MTKKMPQEIAKESIHTHIYNTINQYNYSISRLCFKCEAHILKKKIRTMQN